MHSYTHKTNRDCLTGGNKGNQTVTRKFPQETRCCAPAPSSKNTEQNRVIKPQNKIIIQIPEREFVKTESTMVFVVEFPNIGLYGAYWYGSHLAHTFRRYLTMPNPSHGKKRFLSMCQKTQTDKAKIGTETVREIIFPCYSPPSYNPAKGYNQPEASSVY